MRLVVDTNVFVSAALKEASWPGMVVRWLDQASGLLQSDATEAQVIGVLQRPYFAEKLPPNFLERMRGIFARAEKVVIVERITACRDPSDDRFLELAVNGHADLIVSGNRDLLVLDPFRDVPIITPIAFFHAYTI